MYSAFINVTQVSSYTESITAFFSKSSLVWPACLNLYVQRKEKFFPKNCLSINCRNENQPARRSNLNANSFRNKKISPFRIT